VAINCIADIYGKHVFLADGDILVNDGNSVQSILHRVMRTKLSGLIDPAHYSRSFAITNMSNKEVWFCIPTNNSEWPNLAFIYNWRDNKISIRDIPAAVTAMAYGPIAFSTPSWNSLINTWDQSGTAWDNNIISPFAYELVGIDHNEGYIYCMSNDDGNTVRNTSLERLSVQFPDCRTITSILRVYPNVTCTGNVQFQFGYQESPSGAVIWDNPVLYNPSTDRKIEVRTTGSLHSWRISSVGTNDFAYAGMSIEYVPNGLR
jgi:hypothetical protein